MVSIRKKYFVVGAKVQHDFSKTIGRITKVEKRLGDYNYFVEWDEKSFSDWYQKKVLRVL